MRSRWSPSALQSLDQCPRRFALREAGWQPRPDPFKPAAPHADFGRVWHAAAEGFDTRLFAGMHRDDATDATVAEAIYDTWGHDFSGESAGVPLWGTALDQWRCDGGKVPSEKTGKPVQCPASKGWWADTPYTRTECPKCGGPVLARHAYIPHHPTKNRANLLRAVVDYCDEALPGVAEINGAPGLEVDLAFRLAGIDLHCILDRYTSMGPARFAHERKTSSVSPTPWDKYLQTFQVRFYPEALRQNGLRCDGVLMEHYQITGYSGVNHSTGGTQRSTVTLSPGPDHIAEAGERLVDLVNLAEVYDGHAPLDWPGRFSACTTAAGGRPCEFLKVCKAALGRRPELLAADYEQRERGA